MSENFNIISQYIVPVSIIDDRFYRMERLMCMSLNNRFNQTITLNTFKIELVAI